jgi:hypothetical protein
VDHAAHASSLKEYKYLSLSFIIHRLQTMILAEVHSQQVEILLSKTTVTGRFAYQNSKVPASKQTQHYGKQLSGNYHLQLQKIHTCAIYG